MPSISHFLADLDQRRYGGHAKASQAHLVGGIRGSSGFAIKEFDRLTPDAGRSANDRNALARRRKPPRQSTSRRRLYVCSFRCLQEKPVCPSAMARHRAGYAWTCNPGFALVIRCDACGCKDLLGSPRINLLKLAGWNARCDRRSQQRAMCSRVVPPSCASSLIGQRHGMILLLRLAAAIGDTLSW